MSYYKLAYLSLAIATVSYLSLLGFKLKMNVLFCSKTIVVDVVKTIDMGKGIEIKKMKNKKINSFELYNLKKMK